MKKNLVRADTNQQNPNDRSEDHNTPAQNVRFHTGQPGEEDAEVKYESNHHEQRERPSV